MLACRGASRWAGYFYRIAVLIRSHHHLYQEICSEICDVVFSLKTPSISFGSDESVSLVSHLQFFLFLIAQSRRIEMYSPSFVQEVTVCVAGSALNTCLYKTISSGLQSWQIMRYVVVSLSAIGGQSLSHAINQITKNAPSISLEIELFIYWMNFLIIHAGVQRARKSSTPTNSPIKKLDDEFAYVECIASHAPTVTDSTAKPTAPNRKTPAIAFIPSLNAISHPPKYAYFLSELRDQ